MRIFLLALVIAFAVTAILGKPLIGWLQKMKFGQKILEDGPRWHMSKQYTPTMGGFMFMAGVGVAVLALGVMLGMCNGNLLVMGSWFAIYLLALAYGLVGFVDDWAKIKKKQNAGLTALQKLVLQIVVAVVFLSLLRLVGDLQSAFWIPFTELHLELPWMVFLVVAVFIMVGGNNAVNLTDGIDGLAASVTVPVALFFAARAWQLQNMSAFVFAAALVGALLGFLIYNFNPAQVFMGDTGSLFLGGAVVGLAFACDAPLLLPLVGFIYVLETVSVILQVGCFKLCHGKRLFKMAPIHHHFEMCGWGEKKIVFVATAITAVLCGLCWMAL